METISPETDPIHLADNSKKTVRALITTSYRAAMNAATVVPWEDGVELSKLPKREEDSWIYGTRFWEQLDQTQRHEVLWKETARDVSMFIWLEQVLPPLYVGYTNRFRYELSPEVYEYLMIFSKEEIVHTLMFRKYMQASGLRLFKPAGDGYGAFTDRLVTLPPIMGIFWTLMIEWVAELNAMHCTQGDDIEPLTRTMFRAHHIEEVRHIAFGRHVVETYFSTASPEQLMEVRNFIRPAFYHLLNEFTYNSEIAEHVSFTFPVARDDENAIAAIRTSPNNQRLNQVRFKELFAWFTKLAIL